MPAPAFELCTVDVWDTLLRRVCHPDAVKLHTAGELLAAAFDRIAVPLRHPRAMLALRQRIETEQARAARASGFDDEYALPEVFAQWVSRALPGIGESERAELALQLVEAEWRQEARVSYADPGIAATLAGFPARRRCFVSDFYLPAAWLAVLLRDKGLAADFEGGVSSCEPRLNKRSGRLYKHIHQAWRVKPARHVHVGDNPVGDVRIPRSLGIRAIRYRPAGEERLRLMRRRWFDHRPALFRAIDKQCQALRGGATTDAAAFSLGCRLAPLFAGFALFILESARRDRVERLLFCTREGEFFARVYEQFIAAAPGLAAPTAELFEVSRQSTFAATLQPPLAESLMRLWSGFPEQPMQALGLSLGLPARDVAGWCERHGVPFEPPLLHPWQDARVQRLLGDSDVQAAIATHVAARRARLGAYLRSLNLPERGTLGIVDIGWRGSIQDNLALLNPAVEWRGYYLGLQKFQNPQPSNVRKAAFGADLNRSGRESRLFSDLPLLEVLCNAPGGSVTGYALAADGAVQPQRLTDAAEDAVLHATVRHVQDGILAGAAVWARPLYEQAVSSEELRPLAQQAWARLVGSPPRFLKRMLATARHNELFGRGRIGPMPRRGSWLQRFLRRAG